MNENRRKILEMLAAGQITADEAESLMAALEKEQTASATAGGAAPNAGSKPKYLRVLVEDVGRKGQVKVNVRVPMQLLRAGVKLASVIPPEARERVNGALHKEGVPFDLNHVTADNLDDLLNHLDDLTVDINEPQTKVRFFCE
jgi:hypothetical protein